MSFYLMHRGWMDNPVLRPRKKEPFSRCEAWAWLIEKAAFKPARVRSGNSIVDLERGQLSASLRFLGEAWGWNHLKVRRFLSELSDDSMITTEHETGQNIITICNYERYQVIGEPNETPDETPMKQPRNSHETKKKEVEESISSSGSKEPSEEMRARAAPLRGTRLHPDFEIPADWIAAAAAARSKAGLPAANLLVEREKFKNYWLAKSGRDGTKLDWQRTWINWCLNARADMKLNGAENHERTVQIDRPTGPPPKPRSAQIH